MIQETTEHMDEVVTTGEVTSTEPISLSTEPPKRDKPVADPVSLRTENKINSQH